MEIGVLGPVGIWSAEDWIDTGSAREQCILAILALTPRAPVPAEALIDRVWGHKPPPRAREDLAVTFLSSLDSSWSKEGTRSDCLLISPFAPPQFGEVDSLLRGRLGVLIEANYLNCRKWYIISSHVFELVGFVLVQGRHSK